MHKARTCHHASREPSSASLIYSRTREHQPAPLLPLAKPPHHQVGSRSCMKDSKTERKGMRSEGGWAEARAGGNKEAGGLRAAGAAQTAQVGSQEGKSQGLIYANQMHQAMRNCSLLSEPQPGQSTGVTVVRRHSQREDAYQSGGVQAPTRTLNAVILNVKHQAY